MTKDFSLELFDAVLCCVSLETTGTDPKRGGEIYEIGSVKYRGRQKLDTFKSYIKTTKPVPDSTIRRRNLDPSDISSAPRIETLLPEFLEFIEGHFLIAFNTSFTTWFLNAYLEKTNRGKLKNFVFGLKEIASKLFGAKVMGSIKTLANKFDIEPKELKTCVDEAEMMHEIFMNMTNLLEPKGVTSLFSLREFQGETFSLSIVEEMQMKKELQRYIQDKITIEIDYYSPWTEKESIRKIDPYEIRMKKRSLYLIGYCHVKKDVRYFRLKRIRKVIPTFEKFEKPSTYEIPEFFED